LNKNKEGLILASVITIGIVLLVIAAVIIAIVAMIKKKGHVVLIVYGTILAVVGAVLYMASSSQLNNSEKMLINTWNDMWTDRTSTITVLQNTLAGSKVMATAGIIFLAIGVLILITRRRSSDTAAQSAAHHNAVRTDAGFCPQCGAPMSARAAFCAHCGGSVSAPPEREQTVPPAEKPPQDTDSF